MAGEKEVRQIIVSTFLLLALITTARAQTVEQVGKLSDFFERSSKELAQIKENLLGMADTPAAESGNILNIYDSITHAECVFDQLHIVATILSIMKDSRDQAAVRMYLVVLGKGAVKQSNATLRFTNRELARNRSPAVIAEMQKARDLVQRVRDEIQRVIPDS